MKGGSKTHLRAAPGGELALCGLTSPYGLRFVGGHYVAAKYPSCKNCRMLDQANKAMASLKADPRGGEDWFVGERK